MVRSFVPKTSCVDDKNVPVAVAVLEVLVAVWHPGPKASARLCLKLFINQSHSSGCLSSKLYCPKLCSVSSYLKWIGQYLFADFSTENNFFYKEMVPC